MSARVGLADLARLAVRLGPDDLERGAALLGLGARPPDPPGLPNMEAVATAQLDVDHVEPKRSTTVERELAKREFLRLEEAKFTDATGEAHRDRETGGLLSGDLGDPTRSLFAAPPPAPLAPWSRLWPVLRERLQCARASHEPDVPALVELLVRGQLVQEIPRIERRTWPERLALWLDESPRLSLFFWDEAYVKRRLSRVCPKSGLVIQRLNDGPPKLDGARANADTTILVLGDLGAYGSEQDQRAWREAAGRMRRCGALLTALVPVAQRRLDPRCSAAWRAIPWERAGARGRGGAASLDTDPRGSAERLLDLTSCAIVVQPGLLRALRSLLPPGAADVSTEADAWNHADVATGSWMGMELHDERRRERSERLAAFCDGELLRAVSRAIETWHERLPMELVRGEVLAWSACIPSAKAPPPGDDLASTHAFVRRFAEVISDLDIPAPRRRELKRFGRVFLRSVPDALYREPALSTSLHRIRAATLEEAEDEASACAIWQVGDQLVFRTAPASGAWPSGDGLTGSPVALAAGSLLRVTRGAEVRMTDVLLRENRALPLVAGEELTLENDVCRLVMRPWQREPWAVAAGRDRFGLWAEADVKGVSVRFRWLPPGRFRMGSPKGEVGRSEWEGPQRTVTWTVGRWLADAPVTQALWTAVMGENPSRFKSPDRPVETVSWDDCQRFLAKLNVLAPGLLPRLPTEAEWEYACRAGTSTATWAGDLDLQGANNAPNLDPIAWYGGNCGVGFELKDGVSRRDWREKQYPEKYGGTHPVKKKAPNPFGLYDMIGNVYEWCADAWVGGERYPEGDLVDPPPGRMGSGRVGRGGSWGEDARYCRAAYRVGGPPGSRDSLLGFRLARGQAPGTSAEPREGTRSGPSSSSSRGAARAPVRDAPARRKKT